MDNDTTSANSSAACLRLSRSNMAADASKFVLPTSPNWYCSAVADCSLSRIYAFGARNCVYLLDVSSATPVFEGQLAGHAERVTSVSFSKHKLHENFLASGSDDKTVKIWDLETKLALLEHKAHNVSISYKISLNFVYYLKLFTPVLNIRSTLNKLI